MPAHVFQHEVHQRHIVRSVLENVPKRFGLNGLGHDHAVENASGLMRRQTEQNLKGVEHRVHGTEIIDFSLIERLHGRPPVRAR